MARQYKVSYKIDDLFYVIYGTPYDEAHYYNRNIGGAIDTLKDQVFMILERDYENNQ